MEGSKISRADVQAKVYADGPTFNNFRMEMVGDWKLKIRFLGVESFLDLCWSVVLLVSILSLLSGWIGLLYI